MKKLLIAFLLPVLFAFNGCKDPCKNIVTYSKLDPEVLYFFYKPGSYWVYRDSADGITDSQYVYAYQYNIHYHDPSDTFYAHPPGNYTYCGPYYLDDITMNLKSIKNGLVYDTLSFYEPGSSTVHSLGEIYGHGKPQNKYTSGATFFILNWPQTGFMNCCFSLTSNGSGYDTTGAWNNGIQTTVASGNYVFNKVYVWGVKIGDGTCPRFSYATDIYVCKSVGIIKMIQHLPGRDVKWDLINYHIEN